MRRGGPAGGFTITRGQGPEHILYVTGSVAILAQACQPPFFGMLQPACQDPARIDVGQLLSFSGREKWPPPATGPQCRPDVLSPSTRRDVERLPLPTGLTLGFPPASSAPATTTTLVIRNLPEFFDNLQLLLLTLSAEPDFILVIRDLATSRSLGYGFVNCRTAEHAALLYQRLHGANGISVTWASVQGFTACWRQHVRSHKSLRNPLMKAWVAPCQQHVVDEWQEARRRRVRTT